MRPLLIASRNCRFEFRILGARPDIWFPVRTGVLYVLLEDSLSVAKVRNGDGGRPIAVALAERFQQLPVLMATIVQLCTP